MPSFRSLFALRSVVAACLFLLPAAAATAQPITWTGAGDGVSWNQSANWSPVGLPGPTNSVIIPSGSAINLNVGTTIQSLSTDRAITQTSGCSVLTITGGLNLGAAGSITTTASFCNNLNFTGTQSITGTGIIRLNSGSMTVAGSSATLTVASGVTIEAANNSASISVNAGNTLLNQGTIRANAASRTISIGGTATSNLTNDTTGVIEASNTGTVNIATVTWTNNGTFLVNNGTLSLGGSFAAFGTISRTAGTVNLTGSYTGPTLTISNATGPIVLGAGVGFNGTTLNAIDGQTYTSTASFSMNACTLNAPLTLGGGCSVLTITGGLNLGAAGSITTTTAFCNNLTFTGTQSITGTGIIRLNSGSMTVAGSSATLTVASGVTIEAANNSASISVNASNTLLNQGTIRANAASRTINIGGNAPCNLTNDTTGVIEASNTGTVSIATVTWTNNGTFLVNNGTLSLGGSFAAIGTISRTGGTINLTGNYSGATISANAASGSFNIGGNAAFTGTTFNAADGQGFTLTSGFSMNACTLNAPLTLSGGCSVLTVTGGLHLGTAGSITTGASFCNNLTFSGTQAITGTGIIRLNSGFMTVAGSSATLTVASGVTIEAANNSASISVSAGNTLLNQGTIRANAASRTINIGGNAPCNLTNDTTGVIEASNTGTVSIATVTWTNNGTFLLNNGTLNLGGTGAALGTINRTAGTVNLTGSYTGPTLTISNATGPIVLGAGVGFNGTTLNAIDGQTYTSTASFSMNACTLNAPLTLGGGCSVLTITGGLHLGTAGSITTGASFCNNLTFSGTQAITGTGIIRLNSGFMTVAGSSATLTVASGVTIEAANNSASISVNASNTLLNQGTIRANAASRTINIGGNAPCNLTNDTTGVIEASNTGTVSIATVTWTNNGTFLLNNGTLNLGGTGAALGTINRTGGTVNLTGSYTGPTLTISNATGPIVLGAGVGFNGTTLNAIDGQTYTSTASFSMNACTLNAPLTLSGGCSFLTVTGGLHLGTAGSITTGASFCNNLTFSGTQAVTGTGQIILASGYATVSSSGAVLTVGGGITIRNTGLHNASFIISAGTSLVNLGTITATGATRSLTVNGTPTSTFSNQPGGTLSAFSAGQLVIDNNLGNSGRIVAGTNGTVVLAASRILTNTVDGEIELQGTGPNSTTDFGHIRILGTLNAGGTLAVTYPNGLVPGCRIAVPIITTQGAGIINGQFAVRTGPPKPSPFAIYFSVTPTGAIFSSTNLADVGSAGAVPQPDGVLDNNDFIVFIDLFFSLNPIADRGSTGGVPGADGAWDNNDFIVYIDQFFAGCG